MKVGLIVPGYSADADDWCIPALVDAVRELTRQAEVHVFALRYPYRRDRYSLHGAEVHALGGGATHGVRRGVLLAAALRHVRCEHRRAPFDVIHGVWADEPGAVAVRAGDILGVPSVVSVMGGDLLALHDINYGGSIGTLNRGLIRFALRESAAVTAGSSQGVEAAERLAGRRVLRLPWGVDPTVFAGAQPIRLEGDFRVLHVGSLVSVKDHTMLLRAAARARASIPGFHLHLAGDGPRKGTIVTQVAALGLSDVVTLRGHVPRHDLAGYYRAADVLAVSSRHEMQPMVAIEAALCGLPTVGTAVGLIPDLAPDAAISVPVGDERAMSAALERVFRGEGIRELRSAATARAQTEMTAPSTVARLLQLYLDVRERAEKAADPRAGARESMAG